MGSDVGISNTEAAILTRVIESYVKPITPDVAHYLLSMQLPRTDEETLREGTGWELDRK